MKGKIDECLERRLDENLEFDDRGGNVKSKGFGADEGN